MSEVSGQNALVERTGGERGSALKRLPYHTFSDLLIPVSCAIDLAEGREPGHALIDSDLDWGQDFLLLKRELRSRQISTVHYGFFGTMNPCGPDLPRLLPLVPKVPETGWIVLSEQFYRSDFFVSLRRPSCASPHYRFDLAPGGSFDWLKAYDPVARIGATLRLYYVPEGRRSASSP